MSAEIWSCPGRVTAMLDSEGYIKVRKEYEECTKYLTLTPPEAISLAGKLMRLGDAAESLYGEEEG